MQHAIATPLVPEISVDASTADPWSFLKGFERLSFCDWPGHASCVLFFGGCNLTCPTCHNARIAWRPETMPTVPRLEVKKLLKERARWLDGITVTGGEACNVAGLASLLAELKEFGLPIKLDTNGMRPDIIECLLQDGLVDVVALDVKGPYRLYPQLTGQAISTMAAAWNLKYLFAMAKSRPGMFSFRCTTVPLLAQSDIEETRRQLPAGHDLTLQPYKEPKKYAHADLQTRRLSGNVVPGPHCRSNPEGSQSQRR